MRKRGERIRFSAFFTLVHAALLPPVNHNNCDGDCFLCVFPLDSIIPAARRDWASGKDTSKKQRVSFPFFNTSA